MKAPAWIVKMIGQAIISGLWWAGDFLFDYVVDPVKAAEWRTQTEIRWQRKMMQYEGQPEPETMWGQNRKRAVLAQGAYMGFKVVTRNHP